MSSFWATEMEYRDVSCNKPKLLKIRAKCLNRLRSMLKHGQAKMQDRDEASLNSLETIANARKVLKMSAFVHEARTTEMEDHAETFRPTNPKQPQLPGKGRQSVSSFVNAALKWKTQSLIYNRNCRKIPQSSYNVFVRYWNTSNRKGRPETFPPCTNPKQPQLPGMCRKCLRS